MGLPHPDLLWGDLLYQADTAGNILLLIVDNDVIPWKVWVRVRVLALLDNHPRFVHLVDLHQVLVVLKDYLLDPVFDGLGGHHCGLERKLTVPLGVVLNAALADKNRGTLVKALIDILVKVATTCNSIRRLLLLLGLEIALEMVLKGGPVVQLQHMIFKNIQEADLPSHGTYSKPASTICVSAERPLVGKRISQGASS